VITCAACDTCQVERKPLEGDARRRVQAVLAMAAQLGGRFGRTRMANLLAGDDDDGRFADLPGLGALRREGSRQVLPLIRALEGAGLLIASGDEYPTLAITPLGRKVLAGQAIAMALPGAGPEKRSRRRAPVAVVAPAASVDPELLDRLRTFRREAASREALPSYCILTDRTLDAIARARPADMAALGVLPGIGPIKLAKYGSILLDLIRGGQAAPAGPHASPDSAA